MQIGIKIRHFLEIPLVIAILSFAWMEVAARFNLHPWVGFVTWGAYFLTGCSLKSAGREALGFTLGLFFGLIIHFLAFKLQPMLGDHAAPLVVGIAAFIIVSLELAPWFDMAPSYFLGAGVYFAAGGEPQKIPLLFVAGMVGLAFGILSALHRGHVFKRHDQKDPIQH
ncbi:MAG: DUF1097 domain-containing protein [Gammaproteobacteria bacterium]|nr:DUF1097 domain-containing protein [Gammaproteobacteria bacterium]